MKTVAVNARSREMKSLLEMAKREDLVLKTRDGDEFILSPIDDFEHEIALQRRNKKLMTFLDERFRQSREEKGIPLREVSRLLDSGQGQGRKTKKKGATGGVAKQRQRERTA